MRAKRLDALLSEQIPEPERMIGMGVLDRGSKAILYGKPKTLKSYIALRLALSLSEGTSWLGMESPPDGINVLYVQLELSDYEVQKRLKKMVRERPIKKLPHVLSIRNLKLDQDWGLALLEEEITATGAELVIVDPIFKVLSGEMSQDELSPLFDRLDELIGRTKCAMLLIHHQRKGVVGAKVSGSDEMMGSVLFQAWPDTVLGVRRNGEYLTIKFEMVRNAEGDIPDVTTRIEDGYAFEPGTGVTV